MLSVARRSFWGKSVRDSCLSAICVSFCGHGMFLLAWPNLRMAPASRAIKDLRGLDTSCHLCPGSIRPPFGDILSDKLIQETIGRTSTSVSQAYTAGVTRWSASVCSLRWRRRRAGLSMERAPIGTDARRGRHDAGPDDCRYAHAQREPWCLEVSSMGGRSDGLTQVPLAEQRWRHGADRPLLKRWQPQSTDPASTGYASEATTRGPIHSGAPARRSCEPVRRG